MRYLQGLITLLILPIFGIAQANEGEIRYKQTVKLNIKINGEMSEQLKAMIPSSQTFKKVF